MITVLCCGYLYLNPSRPLLLQALGRVAPERLTVVDVTTASLDETRRRIAESTAIVLDQSLINAALWSDAQLDAVPNVYYMPHRRPRDEYVEIMTRALEAPVARAFFSYSDIHDPKDVAVFDRLAPQVDALFWAYFKAPIDLAAVPQAHRDPFMTVQADLPARFAAIRRQFPVVVDVWHALGAAELETQAARPLWETCIPGANYRTRVIARAAIAAEGLSHPPFQTGSRVMRHVVGRIAALVPSTATANFAIRSEQQMQRVFVRRSRVTFVCGSGLNYAVRKFAEVPGLRSAMITYPCIGFTDLGFRDGVNAVVCDPEDAGRVAKRLLADDTLRRRIADGAFDLVRTKHTVDQRAAEVLECLDRMRAGTLHHGEFVDGRFVVE